MDDATLGSLVQLLIQGMVSAVFIYAWAMERKERQDQAKSFSVERDGWMKELIDMAREAYSMRVKNGDAVVINDHQPKL